MFIEGLYLQFSFSMMKNREMNVSIKYVFITDFLVDSSYRTEYAAV